MMLDEINRKLREKMDKQEMETKPKTIGVKTPPGIYRRLKALKERRGLKSLKEAMLYSARVGLDVIEKTDENR